MLKGGRIQPEALTAFSAAQIVKHYAERAGLDPAAFAGHSLRSGFLTSAAEAGASVFRMMEVSRHKSVDVLRGHVRRAGLFREHAGAALLPCRSLSSAYVWRSAVTAAGHADPPYRSFQCGHRRICQLSAVVTRQ